MANVVAKEEQTVEPIVISQENKLEILDERIRKKYLSRLLDMDVKSIESLPDLESDLLCNVRLYRVTEMVYAKGESVTDKFTTVFNALATYNASVFVLMDSDGKKTSFYLGVRNNEADESGKKRSTVTLGDTLKQTLIGQFPGAKLENVDRRTIQSISQRIQKQKNVTSVSVVGNDRSAAEHSNEQFVQGLEKLALAMEGRPYIGLLIAENQDPSNIAVLRKGYQDLYTKLSPLQKDERTFSTNESSSRSKSFAEMDNKQKAAMIAGAVVSVAGVAAGAVLGGGKEESAVVGIQIGAQMGGQIAGLINSLAPTEQVSKGTAYSTSSTVENKTVMDMMAMTDELLKKTDEYDSFGLWHVAGYFISDDMSSSEIAASNYRSLMNGEKSNREVSAINSWRGGCPGYEDLTTYLSRYLHPRFVYGGTYYVDATTEVSGKELGLHLGLPRSTVSGLPVIEHAEFGKEVNTYQLFPSSIAERPEDRITLGKIFDLGQVTDKKVELNNKSLNMHTFITGSTGSGKSNAVYQMLMELRQDRIPFLVIEPAKGEYKDVFGHLEDVRVFSTNPEIASLIHLNPFMFPKSIHVLEHIDGLVEIFSVCWPMYDAMPAFFKEAILKSYETVGWDLGSSTFDGAVPEYPDFEVLTEQLDELIGASDYAAEIKSNYRGALLTRVRSLTVGLNKYIFTNEQTPYEQLFDQNCILDISRVKSTETKALLMGLMVYVLNEYRVDHKAGNNKGLQHVTVLEEAHNLLKNTEGGSSELIGKSVEMLTNTIAEIRTYGEGFIIVDQSPSSVDIAAIKNTNTKIVLRTPEAHDREAVGRSIGLNADQVEEIAKLPTGVAVVYQNNWICPVLTLIQKAGVEEIPYVCAHTELIRPVKEARTDILYMLMEPWLPHDQLNSMVLKQDLQCLDLGRETKHELKNLISDYLFLGGHMLWKEKDLGTLQKLLKEVLGFKGNEFAQMIVNCTAQDLMKLVQKKTVGLGEEQIQEVCHMLTRIGD